MRRESPRLLPKASAKRRAVCGRLLLVVVEVVLFFDNAFGSFDLVVGNILVRCHYEIVVELRAAALAFVFGTQVGHAISSS